MSFPSGPKTLEVRDRVHLVLGCATGDSQSMPLHQGRYCAAARCAACGEWHLTADDIGVVSGDSNTWLVKGIDWSRPVAQQYQMHSIPHFKVFGPDENSSPRATGPVAGDEAGLNE